MILSYPRIPMIDNSLEYLRGNTSSNDCEEYFSKYKSCLKVRKLYILWNTVIVTKIRTICRIRRSSKIEVLTQCWMRYGRAAPRLMPSSSGRPKALSASCIVFVSLLSVWYLFSKRRWNWFNMGVIHSTDNRHTHILHSEYVIVHIILSQQYSEYILDGA